LTVQERTQELTEEGVLYRRGAAGLDPGMWASGVSPPLRIRAP